MSSKSVSKTDEGKKPSTLTSGVQPALSLTLGSAPSFSSCSTAAKSPYRGKKQTVMKKGRRKFTDTTQI